MGEEDKPKMEEKHKEKEISTEDEIEKPELTKFHKFCERHGINSNLIMLKITLFVMYGGMLMKWWSSLLIIFMNHRVKVTRWLISKKICFGFIHFTESVKTFLPNTHYYHFITVNIPISNYFLHESSEILAFSSDQCTNSKRMVLPNNQKNLLGFDINWCWVHRLP